MQINSVVLFMHLGAVRAGVLVKKVTTEDANGEKTECVVRYMDHQSGESSDVSVSESDVACSDWSFSYNAQDAGRFLLRSEDFKAAEEMRTALLGEIGTADVPTT